MLLSQQGFESATSRFRVVCLHPTVTPLRSLSEVKDLAEPYRTGGCVVNRQDLRERANLRHVSYRYILPLRLRSRIRHLRTTDRL